MSRRTIGLMLCLAALGAVTSPAPAQDEPARATAEAEREKAEQAGLALLAAPFLLLAAVAVRTGISVASAAVFPTLTRRSRTWLAQRPWLCFVQGAFMGIVVLILAAVANNAGDGGKLLAVLLFLLLGAGVAIGGTAVCEVIGDGVCALRNGVEPSTRLASLVNGSVAGMLALLAPPLWLLVPFVLACALGAFRLGFREPEPEPVAVDAAVTDAPA